MSSERYASRGVSATKSEVHSAIKHLDKGLFPNAFCKILPDLVGGDESYANVMHADTAGTKTSLAYLYWKETGDMSVWKGIIQDSLVMNLDDMACVGITSDIIISSTIGRNKNLITGDVLAALINGTQSFISDMSQHGIELHLAGGETADVGDIVRTLDVGFTTFGRIKRDQVVNVDILDGDYIVGFSSSGKASYETDYNGGMGSNGLTSARHDVFSKQYAEQYPESYDGLTPSDLVYCGSRKLTDKVSIDGHGETTIGKLVLSPTRTYLPLIHRLVADSKEQINGLIHCSGGAQTKVMKFVDKNLKLVKDNLFDVPPLFDIIQKESGSTLKEMYQVFNMGHRLEMYTSDIATAEAAIETARSFGIDAKIVGRVVASDKPSLEIHAQGELITYTEF